jgi:hypothetical protein
MSWCSELERPPAVLAAAVASQYFSARTDFT